MEMFLQVTPLSSTSIWWSGLAGQSLLWKCGISAKGKRLISSMAYIYEKKEVFKSKYLNFSHGWPIFKKWINRRRRWKNSLKGKGHSSGDTGIGCSRQHCQNEQALWIGRVMTLDTLLHYKGWPGNCKYRTRVPLQMTPHNKGCRPYLGTWDCFRLSISC